MKALETVLAFMGWRRARGGHGPGPRDAAARGRGQRAVVYVRDCRLCGGDPRHLCRRCREVIG